MEIRAWNAAYSSPARYLADALEAFLACGMPRGSAELLAAHSAHSTGYGRKIWNWNPAGLKATSSQQQRNPYVMLWGSERVNGQLERRRMAWLAFVDLAEGAAAMIHRLNLPRYARARALLGAGDPRYIVQVGLDGWYTDTTGNVKAGFDRALARLRGH